ncbi:MAG: sugar ABC transporter permease, partial [Ruthenibacterium sp.]
LLYMVFTVAFTVIIGLLLAIVIERRFKGWKIYKFIYYIPVMMSITVVATLFAKIYEPSYGILNSLLGFLNLDFLKQAWLGDPKMVLPSIIFTSVWQYSGFTMILFLVGLEGISPDIHEAATLDGVTELQRIRYITLPCVKRIIYVTIMLQMIFSFKSFDIIWVMTKGGPGTSSEVLGTLLYKTAFNYQDFGYASAIAVVMTVIIGSISLIYMKMSQIGGDEQ